jgi:hypothetical protein
MLKAKSHVPCRAPAMLRPCRFERDFSTPRQGNGVGTAGVCELTSAVSRRPLGDLHKFGLLPVTTRAFSRVVFPVCCYIWDVFNCYDDDGDSRLHGIRANLKVKAGLSSVVMLRLHCIFILRFSSSERPILKYLKFFCLLSLRRPNRV